MSHSVSHRLTRFIMVLTAVALIAVAGPLIAGLNNNQINNVGGISIDAHGVVSNALVVGQKQLRAELLRSMTKVPGELTAPTPIRKISLKGLNAAIANAMENNQGVLPDEVRYLAGLQRIEYVFVYPEENDIVIAGPGEGWTVDDLGNVVGITTGRPVLQLEDLIVAFRSVDKARTEGITCSIDPSQEGLQRLSSYLSTVKQFHPRVPTRCRTSTWTTKN